MEYLLKGTCASIFSYASRTYYKMNITDFLNIMELTPEEDRALLYSTSATLALCCMYRGFFLTKKICVCTYRHFAYASKKRGSKTTYASKNEKEPIYVGANASGLSEHVIEPAVEPFEKDEKLNMV